MTTIRTSTWGQAALRYVRTTRINHKGVLAMPTNLTPRLVKH
jgi:hypothetical protein